MEKKFLIEDNSGDKDCFTIVPNYIVNHSTANEQALYLQLKRLAGDKKDYCYPSFNYLAKQLHIGKKAIKKSLKYLIEHKWIENLGKKQVMTAGGYQWVSAYKINNIWHLNNEYYKGVSKSDPLAKGGSEDTKGGSEDTKGGLVVGAYKERIKNVRRTSSFKKKKKPFYKNMEMRFAQGRWWVIPANNSEWLEFAGKESEISWL